MEARQRVQLTGTNRSFGLIALINQRPARNPQDCVTATAQSKGLRESGTTFDQTNSCFGSLTSSESSILIVFAGLVALARRSDPIPSRTRPSNASAPMVLCLKTRESRSSPGLQRTIKILFTITISTSGPKGRCSRFKINPIHAKTITAGWSSPVARQAHNLKAAGSNPAPATKYTSERPKDYNGPWAFAF